jgi:nitrite reductase (NADH) large subunit
VVEIDRVGRQVKSVSGLAIPYDRLLIATGSSSFIIPVPGAGLPGVVGFRDLKDVETMLATAARYKKAVVIGGGLLGLEAANGLMKQGMDVTVVHLMDSLLERQLDQAKVCADHLAHLGYGRYEGSVTSTKLKVTGIDLFSAG